MREANELQRAVLEELGWEPSVDAAAIGVAADDDGVVTLSGHVASFVERRAAERAAKRVLGVRGVANGLVVKLPAGAERDDTDIADATLRALKWNTSVPHERIRVTVSDGWVTLEGQVDWYFQKAAAFRSVQDLVGVRGVVNRIEIVPRVSAVVVKDQIEEAFRRTAAVDAKQIWVTTVGANVTLGGTVRSWAEYEDAEWAAWSAPGVVNVENRMKVEEAADTFATA